MNPPPHNPRITSNNLIYTYQDRRVGTGRGPNSRYMGGGLWEKRFYLPQLFRVTFWGGWISPEGYFYPNLSHGADDYTLRGAGLSDPPSNRWPDRPTWALWLGWIRVSYWQNYGGSMISPNPYTIRRIIFSIAPGKLTQLGHRRVIAVARYFEDLFDGTRAPLSFGLETVQIRNVESGEAPIGVDSETQRTTNSKTLGIALHPHRVR